MNSILIHLANYLLFAQETATRPSFFESMMSMLPLFIVVFFIFHILVIRPQRKEEEQRDKLLEDIKIGSKVVTTGGIHGRVFKIEEKTLVLELEQNSKVRVEKTNILSKAESSPEKV